LKISLRTAAEARLAAAAENAQPPRSTEELLHELQVHQIELEMQNEVLRQAHQVMEESRDRYADLYDFAPTGYLTLSRTGLMVEANLAAATLLGLPRTQLRRRRFERCIAAPDRAHWQRQFAAIWRQTAGQTQSCELRLQRGSDTHFPALLQCMAVEHAGANPVARIAFTDLSERKHAEEEQRIAAIAFESQEGILVTDTAGTIVRVNRAFTALTGYSAAEAVGQTPALLSSGRHDREFYRVLWQTVKEKHFWHGEIWNRHKNGRIYAESLTISAVAAPDGSISHYVGIFSDITLNIEATAKIHRLAYYDPLTDLPNRRLLQDRLGQALAAAARNGLYGAIAFLDLDNFKTLNDTRGHDVGDLLLVEVAQRLRDSVREGDTVARIGGDEFVLILEGLSANAAEAAVLAKQVGEKLNATIARPFELVGAEFHHTTSVGICLFRTHESVEELLKHADLALYQAKNAGRHTVRFYDPAMQIAVDARSALESELRHALERGQFCLHYQAQVDAAQRTVGAETLLRWQHPQRGMVAPDEFIPLAEETALILPIGHWVLASACAQLEAWSHDPLMRTLTLAVNVSARQFGQPDFVAQVQQVIASSGADPQLLKLELTESLVLENVVETIAKMQALKALGVRFSMDDFGTGVSSLSYLTRLPLDQLKIDRSFVFKLLEHGNDAIVVTTIITMARSLGLNVIAEGVETEAQREFLAQHDCQAYQGYLFSRPLALADFEAFAQRTATA